MTPPLRRAAAASSPRRRHHGRGRGRGREWAEVEAVGRAAEVAAPFRLEPQTRLTVASPPRAAAPAPGLIGAQPHRAAWPRWMCLTARPRQPSPHHPNLAARMLSTVVVLDED